MNFEKIKSWLNDWRISISVGAVLGLILGLVIGWGIWPVQWTDLAPYHLRPDLREDYLRMAIHTGTTTGEASVITKAWSELGDTAEETLDAVRDQPKFLSSEQIASFVAFIGEENIDMTPAEEVTEPTESEVQDGGPNWWLLGGLCLVLLFVAGVVFYILVLRDRSEENSQLKSLIPRVFKQQPDVPEVRTEFVTQREEAPRSYQRDEQALPVAQFMTTYMVGDNLYDDSYSIDAPTGEFLGECGVGISETVGVGEPKRVTAFEVWLFDKNDIQTVTKVIMTTHAYEDNQLRMRLESKGEPILAEIGKTVLLETATLQLEARIIDMAYGEGAAPDQSFFDRLTLELSAWPKG